MKLDRNFFLSRRGPSAPLCFVCSMSENLGHLREVQAHLDGPVALELVKAVSSHIDSHQGDMRVVHGLKLDSFVAALKGGLIQEEILHSLQHFFEETSLDKPGFKHFNKYLVYSLLKAWSLRPHFFCTEMKTTNKRTAANSFLAQRQPTQQRPPVVQYRYEKTFHQLLLHLFHGSWQIVQGLIVWVPICLEPTVKSAKGV